jgi:hypothetical protein
MTAVADPQKQQPTGIVSGFLLYLVDHSGHVDLRGDYAALDEAQTAAQQQDGLRWVDPGIDTSRWTAQGARGVYLIEEVHGSPRVQAKQAACSVCSRQFAVTVGGVVRAHQNGRPGTRCSGSGRAA